MSSASGEFGDATKPDHSPASVGSTLPARSAPRTRAFSRRSIDGSTIGAVVQLLGGAGRFSTGRNSFTTASSYAPITNVNIAGSGNPRQDARLAEQVGRAVSGAMAAHNPPDGFRRTVSQKHVSAFQAAQRAHNRNN